MKFHISWIFLFIVSSSYAGITYQFSGGRFGDSLLTYAHALWISRKLDLTFFYRPFTLSNKLIMDELETNRNIPHDNCVKLTKNNYNKVKFDDDTLYWVPYYSDFHYEPKIFHRMSAFNVNWDDKKFKELLRKKIAPKQPLENLIEPPKESISIALHVRRGGRWEPPEVVMQNDPLKFPPTSFFGKALKEICKQFNGQDLFVFMFTDDLFPKNIIKELKEYIRKYPITINYRKTNTSDTSFVLDDFFSLGKFDIIIRPCSNFSYMAARIGDPLIEISPKEFKKTGKKIDITEFQIQTYLS